MTKMIPEQKARQGRWGWRGLFILIAALVLVIIAWGGAAFYGEAIDNSTPAADTGNGQGQVPKG
jgi:hypothetical protein